MTTKLLFISALLLSFLSSAQIDFEPNIIVDSHPDIHGPLGIISGDIDGDGDVDIIATSSEGNKLVWFENLDGQGDFSEPKIISLEMNYPASIAVADIDGDGDLDIVAVSTFDNKIAWFENLDGLGNFGPINLIASSIESPLSVQAKDMNGDGYIDIIAGGSHKVIWLENMDGLGSFGSERIISNNVSTTESIVVSDIDGDGDMDVVIADNVRNIVSWFENIDAQGNFGPERIITDDAIGTDIVVTTDIDNDGDLDVVSVSDGNYIAWFENTDGFGNFSSQKVIATDLGLVYKLFAADLDGDGDNDILASLYQQDKIIWLENDGSGNFGAPQVIYSGVNPIPIIADDFNGDGKMDAVAGFYGTSQITWFENRGPLGIEDNLTRLFRLYPNPNDGLLNIDSTIQFSEINIHNNLGQLLLSSRETKQLDISTLSAGIYFVKITNQKGQTDIRKIIKN